MKFKQITILLLLILIFPVTTLGQNLTTGSLKGKIVDKSTGQALAGANIILLHTLLGVSSDLEGNFRLSNIPVGAYEIKADMMGYKSLTKSIKFTSNEITIITFELEETVIESPTLIVTASKKAQSFQDVPNSVSIVSLKDIKRRNKTYLNEALEYVPGVYFMKGEVNIRGSSGFSLGAGSRVLLLIDGIPMMPGDSGDIKWDTIPLSQIERVEIVKGAGSALYGSQALGGVINIITKDPKSKPGTHVQLSAGIYDEPYYPEWKWTDKTLHFNQMDVTHSRTINKLGLLISGGRKESTGYQENGDYTRYHLLSKLKYKFNSQSSLTFFTNWTSGEYGEIFLYRNANDVYQMPIPSVGDWVETTKYNANAVYRHLVSPKFTYKIRSSYFFNDFKQHYHDTTSYSKASKTGLEIQGDYLHNKQHTFTFGIEGIFDNTNSAVFGTHDGYTWAGYIQDEITCLKTLSLTLGGRFDYHRVDIGVDDSQFNPKFGLNYKPRLATTIRASIGRGFRTPTMAEMFTQTFTSGFKIIPNPYLKAESAWSFEVGINQFLSEQILFDIALFQNDYTNFIEPEPDIYQTVQFINVSEARIRGAEVSTQLSFLNRHLLTNFGYTYLDPINKKTKKTLAYRPEHSLTSGFTIAYSIFEAGIDYRYMSRLKEVKVYPNDKRVAQKIWDARISATIKEYMLSLNINNMFQYNYLQVERNMAPMRNIVFTVNCKF